MITITRYRDGEAFHHGLQCSVRSATYNFRERRGRLDMEEHCCCDMSGCITFFEAIDPKAQEIETFAGEDRDTAYVRRPKLGWEAVRPDGCRMGSFVKYAQKVGTGYASVKSSLGETPPEVYGSVMQDATYAGLGRWNECAGGSFSCGWLTI